MPKSRHPCGHERKTHRRSGLYVIVSGIIGLTWLLLRSGTKPSRLSYPCQQSALGLAATAFGVPVAISALSGRQRLLAFLRRKAGLAAIVGLASVGAAIAVIGSSGDDVPVVIRTPRADFHPDVFLVNNARGPSQGRFGGVDDLVTLMQSADRPWYRSTTVRPNSGPNGLFDADDVVLVKVNAQWAQRGGTNTDVLRGILRVIVEHPDGFTGEIVVADNGQGVGNLDRTENNAEDHAQSPLDVANDFAAEGWKATVKLWDTFRTSLVSEYSVGDMNDGYIVSGTLDAETQIRVSYPKFRTAWGTYISYKQGIWNTLSSTYDPDKLVVISVPVFKTHSIYGVTASVKMHMGVITQSLSTDSHNGVGRGGLGSVLAEVRRPDLTILDCIWVLAHPGWGPGASYVDVNRRDQLAAGFDPVALDAWAVKNIMVPQLVANGFTTPAQYPAQDPDNPNSTFRRYLDRSMNELLAVQIPTTNDYQSVRLWTLGTPVPALSSVGVIVLVVCLLGVGAKIISRRNRTVPLRSEPSASPGSH